MCGLYLCSVITWIIIVSLIKQWVFNVDCCELHVYNGEGLTGWQTWNL